MYARKQQPKGVIVWDFDRVLFDTDHFYREAEKIFKKYDISSKLLWRAVLKIRKDGSSFSTAKVLMILRGWKVHIPEKKVRKDLRNHLVATKYFGSDTDKLLHRLRKQGFLHVILSYGSPSYLHRRIKIGCGERFIRHFVKISATRRPKSIFIKKLSSEYKESTIFFVDDTRENIESVKTSLPDIITVHHRVGGSLGRIEKAVLSHFKKKHA